LQFPVLAAAAFLVHWSFKYTRRIHLEMAGEMNKIIEQLLKERELRILERDARIQQLLSEIENLRARRSRTKKTDQNED
jgi:hypothetical protein